MSGIIIPLFILNVEKETFAKAIAWR